MPSPSSTRSRRSKNKAPVLTLHASTPEEYRRILTEDSEEALMAMLDDRTSYPATVTIHHRLAGLREQHAVHGLLASAAYKEAKARADEVRVGLDEAKRALADAQRVTRDEGRATAQAESERAQIEADMLGFEWRHQLARSALEEHFDYRQAVREAKADLATAGRASTRNKKEVRLLERKIAVAIIRQGHDSPEVGKLREHKNALLGDADHSDGDAPAPDPLAQAGVRKVVERLLGPEQVDEATGERYYAGGEIDLDERYAVYREQFDTDIELAVQERAAQLLHEDHTTLRLAVAEGERALRAASEELDIHDAAIRRAKGRAARARERVVPFERQTLDSGFDLSVQSRPGQPRAIFVRNSVLLDHMLYCEWQRSKEAQKARVVHLLADERFPQSVLVIPGKLHPSDQVKWQVEQQMCLSLPVRLQPGENVRDAIVRHLSETMPTIRAQALDTSWERVLTWAVEHRSDPETAEVWADGDSRFHVFGDVPQKQDARVIRLLHDGGAKVTDNQLEVPTYSSWTDIKPGKRLSLPVTALGEHGTVHYVPHYSLVPGKKQTHDAPFSERGVLHVEGMRAEAAVEALSILGLHGGLVAHVPYDLVYRGTHRFGRVTPMYEPFASGRDALRLPAGHMVIHGLTGIGGSGAPARLRTIIETGGLKSIAERRRMNIHVQSMSPLGDIASGTDTGVPTKFGESVTYGGTIYFAMHPDILGRRDLWFSDRDFGGGHNRFDQYEAYAKKIGQKHIYLPCPTSGRQQHLDDGLGSSNEVYFRHEISWNDVDTLFVATGMLPEVERMVADYQERGWLPAHIRVEGYGDGGVPVAATASWEIDEQTGEVIYVQGLAAEVVSHDINSRIQARARELLRTME